MDLEASGSVLLNALSQRLTGITEKKHECLTQNRKIPDRKSKLTRSRHQTIRWQKNKGKRKG